MRLGTAAYNTPHNALVIVAGAYVGTAHGSSRGSRQARTGQEPPSETVLRSVGSGQLVLVSVGHPRTVGPRRQPAPAGQERTAMSALAPSLQAWFTDRLANQLHASPHTVAAY